MLAHRLRRFWRQRVAEKQKRSSVPAKVDDREQSQLFIKKAREIGADEALPRARIAWEAGKETA